MSTLEFHTCYSTIIIVVIVIIMCNNIYSAVAATVLLILLLKNTELARLFGFYSTNTDINSRLNT